MLRIPLLVLILDEYYTFVYIYKIYKCVLIYSCDPNRPRAQDSRYGIVRAPKKQREKEPRNFE